MSYREWVDFSTLEGQTLVEINVGDDEIVFRTDKGAEYKMYHEQDCCESVWVEDVCGDVADLLHTPILKAEETSEIGDDNRESSTWTFYHLRTIRGTVTIRWCGTSNGYYSESVSFTKVKDAATSVRDLPTLPAPVDPSTALRRTMETMGLADHRVSKTPAIMAMVEPQPKATPWLVGTNAFVRRQTKDSPYSYTTLSWERLETLLAVYMEIGYRKGDKPGTIIVDIPSSVAERYFYTGVVEVTKDTELIPQFTPRRNGEQPYIQVRARGPKLQAKYAEVVLYSHETLGAEASTECPWEIVSINARVSDESEPPTPMAMARNMLGLPGGTDATYTAQEFAESIVYWSTRAMHDNAPTLPIRTYTAPQVSPEDLSGLPVAS